MRLLDTYYSTERPLPLDRAVIYAMVRATTKREKDVVDSVLLQFWKKTRHGFENKRAKKELAKCKEISRKRSNAAKQRSKRPANAEQMLSKRGVYPEPYPEPEPNPPKTSQDQVVEVVAAARSETASAAIKSVFDILQTNPFGSRQFQETYLAESNNGAKSWVDVMEHTIRACHANKVVIPRRFYTIKHVLEKLDAEQSFKRTPL